METCQKSIVPRGFRTPDLFDVNETIYHWSIRTYTSRDSAPIYNTIFWCETRCRFVIIYNDHAVDTFNSRDSASIIIKPIFIWLGCCGTVIDLDNISVKYEGIEDDISLSRNGKEKVSGWNDTLVINETDWSVVSLLTEVCLHAAKWVHNDQR